MCEVPYLMCQKTRKAKENGKKGDFFFLKKCMAASCVSGSVKKK